MVLLEYQSVLHLFVWLKKLEIVKVLSKSKAVRKCRTLLYALYCKLVGVWDDLGSWQWLGLEDKMQYVDSSFCYQ